MLKIEIMKFQAQDIITTSVATPDEGPKCICKEATPNEKHRGQGAETHYVGNRVCPYPHTGDDCAIN